ncbi:DUF6493 family protein [Streptosporangium sp. NPDC023825]|uniref:DUF7824 domain-containing protein n=1 Tax=Streptosporangium sp. NPDC023825 TaxID=3154909 RepID=UPI003414FF13
MTAWQEVRDLITRREAGPLADRVVALTEAERAEVAGRLPGFLKELRETTTRMAWESGSADLDFDFDLASDEERDDLLPWEEEVRQAIARSMADDVLAEFGTALRIAGAGTISGPAAVAAWLARRELNPRWAPRADPAGVVRVLAARPAGWQADVAGRLSRRIRAAGDRIVPLALALLRASGCEPPEHDPLVLAWLSAEMVDDDPLTGPLLARIFEVEGAGRVLREERLTPVPTRWLSLLGRLLAAGKVSREELLDGCVSRFLRGGDAIDLRFFVRLHDLIDPMRKEAAARARDYLRLLPAAPGTVAELALAQVRGTGPHDGADVVEAIGALTFRPEVKMARAGLSWLDEEVRRSPACADELAHALVTAFAHTSYEVQGRAAQLALKHATAFGPGAGLIVEAVRTLPAALGARVAARFGGETAPEEAPEPFVPAALPVLAEPGRFPAPTLDLDPWDLQGWVTCERWLAGFVERAGAGRTALREKLAPVFDGTFSHLSDMERWFDLTFWAAALAMEVITPGTDPVVEVRRRRRLPNPGWVSPPHMFLLHRFSELHVALREGTLPPVLLATPTVMTGHLDPDVLVDRLEVCAAAGAEPPAADLQQALLRLPRGTHPDAADRAARVGSQAAASAAAWLAGGGMPDPQAGLKWGYVEDASEYLFEEREPRHVGQIRLVPVLRAEPTGHDLIDELLGEPSKWRWEEHGGAMDWWPAVLPSHREVVSVNYLPHLLYQWNQPGVCPPYLAALSEADGPVGDATALILAYFLAERRPEAIPPLLRMAARGDLPAEAVGHQLALLIRRTWFEIRPALASLTDAARQGAHEQVWEILRNMLPVLLPGEGERPTVVHSEAVALAADVAAWAGARGEIPIVSAHAASGRGSRFARECARLRDRLR